MNDSFLKIFSDYKLPLGFMLSGSKSFYRLKYRHNTIVFNSNIFFFNDINQLWEKIWFGDIDISLQGDILKDISKEIGHPLYVVSEMNGRFGNADNQNIDSCYIWNTNEDTPFISNEKFQELEKERIKKEEEAKKERIKCRIEDIELSNSLPIIHLNEVFGRKIINHLDFSIEEFEDFFQKTIPEEVKDTYINDETEEEEYIPSFNLSDKFIDYLLLKYLNLSFDRDSLNPSCFVVGEETNDIFRKFNQRFEKQCLKGLFSEDLHDEDFLFHYGSFLAVDNINSTNKLGHSNKSFKKNRIYILEGYKRK